MQSSLFEYRENLLPFDGEAFYYPNLFSPPEADNYFHNLREHINWKQEPIKLFGREIMQPRLTAFYGDPNKAYSYSGIVMHPMEWNDDLLQIKRKIEAITHVNFTAALLNQYRSGQDSMGWHRDNEKELGTNPVIGSVSFGVDRKFQLRHYKDKTIQRSVELSNGSYLLMQGATQHFWEHQVPKTGKVIGPRINITFRVLL